MTQSGLRALRLPVALVLVLSGTLFGVGASPAQAQVTAVTGSAYGFFGNVGLFGGPPVPGGPQPSVTLPAGGSATPVTAIDPACGQPGSSTACTPGSSTEAYTRGPAHIYESGVTKVTTVGSPGLSGSVTSTTDISGCAGNITNSCTPGQVYAGPFTADHIASTCMANETGTSGSATITNGVLVTSTFADGSVKTTAPVPANPPPNTVMTGTNDQTGINGHFKWTFNEQIVNPDGSTTVHAGHEVLGDTTPNSPAHGDLYIGEVRCGVTATGAPPTTTTTSTITVAPTTTTTTAHTTTVAPTTTNPPVVQLGGSAFGYYTLVGLFGGPQVTRGPIPKVTLPPGGSATPVTASVALGTAVYGPAHIFESGPVTVSTRGTPGPTGSVTSSSSVSGCPTAITNSCNSGEIYGGPFSAASATSTCTASAAGITASTKFVNAKLVTLDDANSNPITTVPLPADPPPNDTIFGHITTVNGSFKWVFNEQIKNPDGSITVNAGHEYLGGGPDNHGPAKGDLIFGQSVCAWKVSASSSAGQGPTAAALNRSLAASGGDVRRLIWLALMLLTTGWVATRWAAGRRRPLRMTPVRGRPASPPDKTL